MDKKIGRFVLQIAFFINFCSVVFASKSIDFVILNQSQQEISAAQIGIPFLLQIKVHNVSVKDEPKGLETAQNCAIHFYGKSQNSTYINGVGSTDIMFNYIITPEKIGILELGPIQVVDQDGTIIKSKLIKVKINDISEPEYKAGQPYLLMTEVDQSTIYVGQKLKLSIKFCYVKGFQSLNLEHAPFKKTHVGYQDAGSKETKLVLDGQEYRCKQVSWELYPQEVGTLVIPVFQAQFMPEMQEQNIFSLFGFAQGKVVQSQPRGVRVIPLPLSNQYKDVTAIGDFNKISFAMSRKKGQVGEGIVAKMVIEGNGNLDVAKAPKLTVPEGVHFYEGNATVERVNETLSRKTFEWIVQANKPGTFTIPIQTFTYFDLKSETYKTLQASGCEIVVEGVEQVLEQDHQEKLDGQESVQQELANHQIDDKIHTVEYQHVEGTTIFLGMSKILNIMIVILMIVLLGLVIIWWNRQRLLQIFFVQKIYYSYRFWRLCRQKDIQGIYQLFEKLSVQYHFDLQGLPLQDCFLKQGLTKEAYENWTNFIQLLLEFNFAAHTATQDRELALHLAKQWFPIILLCCKSLYLQQKKLSH